MTKNILTGIRANGEIHLGNYLGAIKPMVDLQKRLESGDKLFMFVPDLHSFTTPIDHSELYQNTLNNIRLFLASGLDPDQQQTLIYRQSRIPAHSELCVILQNFVYFGEASRMIQFKDKSEKLGHKAVSVGLMTYPILMAADIYLYDADFVPLGDDQKQHMELAQMLAGRMNAKFGELFTVPKPWAEQLKYFGRAEAPRIMSLTHPENKMSKSIDDPRGTINLTDNPEEAGKKILAATTDSLGQINLDFEHQPGIANLMTILALLENLTVEEVAASWQGKSAYGQFKQVVADKVVDFLNQFQAKLNQIDDASVEAILARGESQAAEIANQKLAKVQKAVGLRN